MGNYFVSAVDPSRAEIFQNLGCAESVETNDRAGRSYCPAPLCASLNFKSDAVLILQELDVEALRLGQGNDLVLEGHEGAVDKAADHDFLAGRLGRSR
jgi:hypothetical protein